ncbi:MAG: 3-hydroxyacyl-ACP dehydratase FabZ [Draconibacterium sp.]|nr:3-hydroxyacyl-ACP dehydratase FabZ [Draconibacterium sp.]
MKTEYNIEEILEVLPHRFPFVFIDRVTHLDPGKTVTAIKNVNINESYFPGHFPGKPIMPGVLILESMAQAGAFLILHDLEDPKKKGMLFTAIENSKFRKPVVPGDQLIIKLELLKFRLGTAKIKGEAFVQDKLVAEATLMASLVDR